MANPKSRQKTKKEIFVESEEFIEDIKGVLRKSKVSVIKEKIDLETENVIWNLKVKK